MEIGRKKEGKPWGGSEHGGGGLGNSNTRYQKKKRHYKPFAKLRYLQGPTEIDEGGEERPVSGGGSRDLIEKEKRA